MLTYLGWGQHGRGVAQGKGLCVVWPLLGCEAPLSSLRCSVGDDVLTTSPEWAVLQDNCREVEMVELEMPGRETSRRRFEQLPAAWRSAFMNHRLRELLCGAGG